MGTILVAYGEPESREQVLTFAVRQAAKSGDDLFVYHVQETPDEEVEAIQDEIEAVVNRTDPEVNYTVRVTGPAEYSEDANVSKQKRLTDAILGSDRDYEYVVMGNIERGTIEGLTLPSLTEAVLETHAIPVLLVPVGDRGAD